MVRLTISIVNFNSGDFLLRCLESLERIRDEVDLEIKVIDNASNDHSIEKAKKKFKNVNYILNKENVGFSMAHNKVLKNLKSEYALVLNPDVEVQKGTLKTVIDFMDQNPIVGAASCKLILGTGQMDWASHRGFPTPWASLKYYFLKDDSLYHLSKADLNKNHEVDAISGAFFLTRKLVLEKVGLFDEKFFMYGEDLDLSLRIKKMGFKVMYLPQVSALHHKGVSSGLKIHSDHLTTADFETRQRAFDAFYKAMEIFYQKNLEKKYPFFVNWLVYLGIKIKWFLAKRKMKV